MRSGLTVSVQQPATTLQPSVSASSNNMAVSGRYSGGTGWSDDTSYTPAITKGGLAPFAWYSRINNSKVTDPTGEPSDCLARTKLRNDTWMRCAKGDLTYTFSKPVRNPTFHINNIGGWMNWTVGGARWPMAAHHFVDARRQRRLLQETGILAA
jgi:hypothetical protein